MIEPVEQEFRASYVDKHTLLRESDVVTLHLPLFPETRHYIGAKELAMMKKTAILVNASRGPIVDEAALVKALKARRIAGAGLDVFEKEPTLASGLTTLANVDAALTPHVGSGSFETRLRRCRTWRLHELHRRPHRAASGEPAQSRRLQAS